MSAHAGGMAGSVERAGDLIGRDQLLMTGEASMYEALQRVRGDLFRARTSAGVADDDALPAIYINDFYQGNIEVLRTLATGVVRDVQLVRSIDTMMRFGRAHPAGALMVRLQLGEREARASQSLKRGVG